jgi:ABC-type multidrug transport system fused ATPase/permease subunit
MRLHLPIVGDFFRYFTIIRTFVGFELALLVLLNLASAIVESIGILLLIPFLAQLAPTPANPSNQAHGLFSSFVASWNISIGATLGLLVLVFVLKGVLLFFLIAYRETLLNRTRQKTRDGLIALYSDLDYRYAVQQSSGFFGNLVVAETDRAGLAMEEFCHVVSALITASIFFSIAVFLYSSLSVFMLLGVGLSFVLLRKLSARARLYSIRITSLSGRLNKGLIQTLQAFKYAKATARFSPLRLQLAKISAGTRQTRNKLALVNAALVAVQEPVLVICLACVFYYAVIIGRSHIALVMVAVLFFYRCMIEMGHFNRHWQWLSSYAGALEQVWTVVWEMKQHREGQDGEASADFEDKIELRDVSYVYEVRPILQQINIRICKNTSVAVVGASGAGKTTLVDLLTGVLKPTQGTVYLDNKDLCDVNLFHYRRSIGYVEQETLVFDDTIANNISMQWDQSTDPETSARIRQAARSSYCDEFIERLPLGYDTVVGERGVKLSGGQRQRLAIARELFKEPKILILDEATSSLDSQSETYIQQSIERLRGSLTIIIISHRLSTIRNVDYVYVLEQGHIIEQGTFADLSRLPGSAFRQMCELQRVVSS